MKRTYIVLVQMNLRIALAVRVDFGVLVRIFIFEFIKELNSARFFN
jgi:hypothetical protein